MARRRLGAWCSLSAQLRPRDGVKPSGVALRLGDVGPRDGHPLKGPLGPKPEIAKQPNEALMAVVRIDQDRLPLERTQNCLKGLTGRSIVLGDKGPGMPGAAAVTYQAESRRPMLRAGTRPIFETS